MTRVFPCTSFTEIKLNSNIITDRKLENYKRKEKLANILLQGLKIIASKKDTTSKLQRVSDSFLKSMSNFSAELSLISVKLVQGKTLVILLQSNNVGPCTIPFLFS
jgi:hypothetical protein